MLGQTNRKEAGGRDRTGSHDTVGDPGHRVVPCGDALPTGGGPQWREFDGEPPRLGARPRDAEVDDGAVGVAADVVDEPVER